MEKQKIQTWTGMNRYTDRKYKHRDEDMDRQRQTHKDGYKAQIQRNSQIRHRKMNIKGQIKSGKK